MKSKKRVSQMRKTDKDLMDQLEISGKAIEQGKVRKWDDFMKDMGVT